MKGLRRMASRTSAKKNKIGITLNDQTLEKLEIESNKLGMSKSAYISMIINKQEEGGKRIKFA